MTMDHMSRETPYSPWNPYQHINFAFGEEQHLDYPNDYDEHLPYDTYEPLDERTKESLEFNLSSTFSSPLDRQIGGEHYKNNKIQPIEYIYANGLDFCEGNVVKYITRHKHKHGVEDLKKVVHYAQILAKQLYGEDI